MKTTILALPMALHAACVSSGPESQLGKQEPRRIEMSRTSDCVFHSTISGFDALDDRYVVLFAMGSRKAYLAEIAGGCFDMSHQSALAAVDGDGNGQICGFGRDSVAYRRMGMVENCRILALEQLSEERRIELGVGSPQKKPKNDDKKEEKKDDPK
ncbi:MAG: DUF6491 family protein [Steroidobacteraceae bacterium]